MNDIGLRLPRHWVALGPVDGHPVAVLPGPEGRPAGVITTIRVPVADPDHTVARLTAAMADLLVLDRSTVSCSDGRSARRILLGHVQHGRGITTELWFVDGPAPAVLCASVETARYARLGPRLHRALRTYRS